MRIGLNKRFVACVSLLVGLSSSAIASSFTVFGTGVDDNGAVLSQGATDNHYSVMVSGATSASTVINFTQEIQYNPIISGIAWAWLANGPQSMWIGVPGSLTGIPENSTVTFKTTFDLTGFAPSTAQISGRWAADDGGATILLNGTQTSVPGIFDPCCWTQMNQLTSFSITSGFLAGLNTLEFEIYNGAGPGGFRAELSGTATETPIPGALPLFATGIALFGLFRRKRMRKGSAETAD